MSECKKAMRKKVLAQRNRLSKEFIIHNSKEITDNLWSGPLKDIGISDTIMCYIPTKGEVDVYPLIDQLLQRGIQVAVPRTYPREKVMEPVPISDVNHDLQQGAYKIYEPIPTLPALTDYDSISIVIIPGVAYDVSGYRLGFGGGYYDRFLEQMSNEVKLIAVAYEFQVYEYIPKDHWDKPVGVLVTERGVKYFK